MAGLYAGLCARLLVAVILIVAAVGKLGRADAFTDAIGRYGLLPSSWVPTVASVLPAVELVLGLALALGILVAPVAAACAVLLAVFATAVAVSLMRGRRFDCGCGLGDPEISWMHVGRSAALTALAIVAALEPAVFSVTAGHVRNAPAGRDLLAVPFGVVLICVCGRLTGALRTSLTLMRRGRWAQAASLYPNSEA